LVKIKRGQLKQLVLLFTILLLSSIVIAIDPLKITSDSNHVNLSPLVNTQSQEIVNQNIDSSTNIKTNEPIEIIRTESTELFKYEENKRVLTIFGGTRYVSEDGMMKPIEAVRSLKNSNIKCIVKEDSDTIAECLDYNATSITIDITLKNFVKKDKMPVKLIGLVQEKDLTNATNGFSRILKTKEQKNIDFSGAGDKKTLTINGNFLNGDKIHIGEASTIVELKDANTEILDDAFTNSANPTQNGGASAGIEVGGINNYTEWVKFNISVVPSTQVIDNAEYYIICGGDSGRTDAIFETYNQTNSTWEESTITDNNKPAYGSLQNTSTNWGVSIVTRINVTKAVKSSYGSGEMISLATYTTGTHDNSNHCTNGVSKEGAYENRHGLNITYSNAPSGGGGGNESNESGEGLPNQITKAEYNFTYDANGNLLQGINKYHEYNNFNQLVRVRDGNSSGRILEEYTYDYDRTRIKKIAYFEGNTNETTYYIGDFVQIINISGTYNFTYYYDNGVLIAEEDQTGKKLFYHPDHLGSTTLITNESGEEVETIFYLPFGDLDNTDTDKRYLYTGKEKDKETGLYYYGARYYDTDLMTFITPEQDIPNLYNPQDLNHYTYVRNNPYKYVDPSGEFVDTALDVAFIVSDVAILIDDPSTENAVALGLDVAGAVIPFITGVGKIYKISKVGKAIDKAEDVAQVSEKGKAVSKAVDKIEDVAKSGDVRNIENSKTLPDFYGTSNQQTVPSRTPAGREITPHAAERMANSANDRAVVTPHEADQIIKQATNVRVDSQRQTTTYSAPQLSGQPKVVTSNSKGGRIVTTIRDKLRRWRK